MQKCRSFLSSFLFFQEVPQDVTNPVATQLEEYMEKSNCNGEACI